MDSSVDAAELEALSSAQQVAHVNGPNNERSCCHRVNSDSPNIYMHDGVGHGKPGCCQRGRVLIRPLFPPDRSLQ